MAIAALNDILSEDAASKTKGATEWLANR